MPFYLIIYIVSISILLFLGFVNLKKNKTSLFGKLFFYSMVFHSLWLTSYLSAFSTTYNKEILIIISRTIYSSGLIASYSMLYAIINFGKKGFSKARLFQKYFLIFLIIFSILSIVSGILVKDMVYNDESGTYNEVFGIFYPIYYILYLIFLPVIGILSYFKIKNLNKINRVRLKYLAYSYLFFIFNETVFLVVLPFFGIWLFQKEHVLFLLPFFFSIFYASYKYNFLDARLLVGRIISFTFSLLFSILSVNIFREYLLNFLDKRLGSFWGISQSFGTIDLVFGIVIFLSSNYLFQKYILGENQYYFLSKKINKLKRKIAFTSSVYEVNMLLNAEFTKLFKTNYVNIDLSKKDSSDLNGLKNYFLKDKSYNLFINDIVFIEENKNKFNYEKIKEEINDRDYLVFCLINNKREFMGVFKMGSKLFQDGYTKEEVDLLNDFVEFLIGHLKYIEIYRKIHDLNINLDKKIDEKTIEYNTLLNKQNDFISMASHEIKSPLGSCIFQLDCLVDDLNEGDFDKDNFQKGLNILNKELQRVGDLTRKIFSIQKYDLGKIELFKQKIDLNILLEDKVEIYIKMNPDVTFIKEMDPSIGEVFLDKIQFEQVLDNLVNNAIKFSNEHESKIFIRVTQESENIKVEIEDNGTGFSGIELGNIFDKYSTGESDSVGLGMGMFLCKKIIELHGGNIYAEKGKKLGGAKFIFKIPKN